MKLYVVVLTTIVLTLVSIPVEASSTPVNQWNPIEDIINKIKEAILSAFNWLVDQLNEAFWGAVGLLLRALSKLVLGKPGARVYRLGFGRECFLIRGPCTGDVGAL